MKAQPTLICIPDISGFSEFMSDIDFEVSSKVIPALLNNIIYSNEIGLKVSEIEGDAVLFFKQGQLPNFKDLINQCKTFYTEFYKQLLELRKAHSKNDDIEDIHEILGLKIILHFGKEIAPVKVGSRIKLLGEDVIVAHRLLKNDIPLSEYILLSDALTNEYKTSILEQNFSWGKFIETEEDYPHVGKIKYNYIALDRLAP